MMIIAQMLPRWITGTTTATASWGTRGNSVRAGWGWRCPSSGATPASSSSSCLTPTLSGGTFTARAVPAVWIQCNAFTLRFVTDNFNSLLVFRGKNPSERNSDEKWRCILKKNLTSRSRDIVLLKEPDYLVEFDRRLNMLRMVLVWWFTLHITQTVPKAPADGGGSNFF